MSGSLMRPFQPTVVRGFSRYARMTMQRSALSLSERALRRRAYSRAVFGSWMEQGPQTTRRRSSRCSMISMTCWRPERTVLTALSGCRCYRVSGLFVFVRNWLNWLNGKAK